MSTKKMGNNVALEDEPVRRFLAVLVTCREGASRRPKRHAPSAVTGHHDGHLAGAAGDHGPGRRAAAPLARGARAAPGLDGALAQGRPSVGPFLIR